MEPDMDILDDIMFKFVYNLGQDCLSNPVQLLFQIERAWWYYEDTVRAEKPYRHYATYGAFTCMLASKVSFLKSLLGDPLAALKEYSAFKVKIPVYGAILMDKDMERVLLVRGQASSSGWGFPKGKINAGEAEMDCACREVMEETGCNIEPLIDPTAFIEAKGQNDKVHKLFIVVGVDPETTAFAPQLAGEIGAYGWHWLGELPATRDDADQAYIASGGKQHKFYMVQPFIGRLRTWVSKRRRSKGLAPPSWEAGGVSSSASRAPQPGSSLPQSVSRQPSQAALTAAAALQTAGRQPAQAAVAAAPVAQPSVKAPVPAPLQAVTAAIAGLSDKRQASLSVAPAPSSASNARAQEGAPTAAGIPGGAGGSPNFVLSSAFRFDVDAILCCLAS